MSAHDHRREAESRDTRPTCESVDEFYLGHSVISLEHGPAGVMARIDRVDGTEYAGPLPPETIRALRETATRTAASRNTGCDR